METTDSTTADAQPPVAVFKKRGAKGKANLRKRAATPPPANSDSDSEYSSEDEAGHRVKRRRKNKAGLISASTKDAAAAKNSTTQLGATVFSADRAVPITSTNDATKQSNWYDEEEGEGDSAVVRSAKSKHAKISDSTGSDGNYKGLANKTTFVQKNPDAPNRSVGPIKAPTNIRTITVTDYAPDVCKDYKKTGFCGFGDNCKYLHSREAYAAGWQLDKEWESVTKGKKNIGGTVVASADRRGNDDDGGGALDEADEAMLNEIPFACIICTQSYREPIVTRCGHYFCEACALKRYRRDPTCAACGVGTNGVFNGAKRLKKLLERKREREAKRRQAAIEAGEEMEEEEGEKDGKKAEKKK